MAEASGDGTEAPSSSGKAETSPPTVSSGGETPGDDNTGRIDRLHAEREDKGDNASDEVFQVVLPNLRDKLHPLCLIIPHLERLSENPTDILKL